MMMIRQNISGNQAVFAGGIAAGFIGFGLLSWLISALKRRSKKKELNQDEELIFLYCKIAKLMRKLKEIEGDRKAEMIFDNIDKEIHQAQQSFAQFKSIELMKKAKIAEVETELVKAEVDGTEEKIELLRAELEELKREEKVKKIIYLNLRLSDNQILGISY
jgi:chromosome segregation ATPase